MDRVERVDDVFGRELEQDELVLHSCRGVLIAIKRSIIGDSHLQSEFCWLPHDISPIEFTTHYPLVVPVICSTIVHKVSIWDIECIVCGVRDHRSGDVQICGGFKVAVVNKDTDRNCVHSYIIKGFNPTEGNLYCRLWVDVVIVQDCNHWLIS